MKKSSTHDLKPIRIEAAMELGESTSNTNYQYNLEPVKEPDQESVKFHPKAPAPREKFGSPMGKLHTRTPKLVPLKQKENFEGEENMLNVFDAVRRQPSGFFLYLTHTYAKNSVNYNFYNVRVVNYVNCNKDEYFTIGSNGVCHFCAGEEIEYTAFERWEQEYKHYLKLINLNVFSRFRRWKAFSVWHVNVRGSRVKNYKEELKNKLFFLNDVNSLDFELFFKEFLLILTNHSLPKVKTP